MSRSADSGVALLRTNTLLRDDTALLTWLLSLRQEEYLDLFLQAGYDLPTVSR